MVDMPFLYGKKQKTHEKKNIKNKRFQSMNIDFASKVYF